MDPMTLVSIGAASASAAILSAHLKQVQNDFFHKSVIANCAQVTKQVPLREVEFVKCLETQLGKPIFTQ
jgi:hypothetical protein